MGKKKKSKQLSALQELYKLEPIFNSNFSECPACGCRDTVPDIFINCMDCGISKFYSYNYIKNNSICSCDVDRLYISKTMYCIQCGCDYIEAGLFR